MVVAGFLGGCGTVPPTTDLFTLQPASGVTSPVTTAEAVPERVRVVRIAVSVPQALDRRALTVRADAVRYTIDDRYQWSLPFGEEVQEALRTRLAVRYPAYVFVSDLSALANRADMRLQFVFDRYEADLKGGALAHGSCSLHAGNQTVWKRPFAFHTEAEATPEGIAQALQSLLDEVLSVCVLEPEGR
nr:ABC-type transport auxiliary lipoprotein family protein [Hydrogenophilus thiooxidans]